MSQLGFDFSPEAFLAESQYIDWKHPSIVATAKRLAADTLDEESLVRNCFEFVRDRIHHSWDFRMNPVTCRASDVLLHGTGYCYAKSHLLAALLRANGIPAGLCYQRLSVGTEGPPYCLHGLNAVYLKIHGWYRIDARGNKPGVEADFVPPLEKLAFPVTSSAERDIPGIWAEPMSEVVYALTQYETVEQVYENLPDIAPFR